MSLSETLYWHDYETFGTNPAVDRPVQFAGLRTDTKLNVVGEPLVIYARPARDYLPHPAACLVTGITPQVAEERGLCEAEFMGAIHRQLSQPGTCALGYNSLRFDDEFTRYGLYRNLYDPYAREYRNRCSRWDLIDVVRTAYALRPGGIEWPVHDNGLPSFRLEDLTAANGLDHGQAHDALSDVQATIAMARLLREQQPKLYDYLFENRSKQAVKAMIDVQGLKPLLHVSGMFGAARANLGLIVPLLWHPQNSNEVICFDLSCDPAPLFDLPADTLRELLYTRAEHMPEGQERPGLKSVHINRCPVLLPTKMADRAIAERSGLDGEQCRQHLAQLRKLHALAPDRLNDTLHLIAGHKAESVQNDADAALYDGFLPDEDREQLDTLRELSPQELAAAGAPFIDDRLPELLFRYRANNYPETLSDEERTEWETLRFQRLSEPDPRGRRLDLEQFHGELEKQLAEGGLGDRDRDILLQLQRWGDALLI